MSKLKDSLRDRQTTRILESVYRNARLAHKATRDVMNRCRNKEFYEELAREGERYRLVAYRARRELSGMGAPAYEASPYVRAMVKTGIAVKTAQSKDTGRLAEIMFRGTAMGIVDMQRTLNRCRLADKNIRASAKKLLRREQQFCDDLKRFL